MNSLDFVDILTADMIMSRLYLDEIHKGESVPTDLLDRWMNEFKLTRESEKMLGIINNYLYLNSPIRDPYLGLVACGLSDIGYSKQLADEQWGELKRSEELVFAHGLKIANELIRVAGLVQGLRAAYLTHFFEVVDDADADGRITRKQQRGEQVTFTANGSSPSLVYMKSLHTQLKDYWAVALRPIDNDRLDASHYLESKNWRIQIGRSFSEEFVDGPLGKIVFSEPRVVPFIKP